MGVCVVRVVKRERLVERECEWRGGESAGGDGVWVWGSAGGEKG